VDALHAAVTRLSIYQVTEIKKPARRLAVLILEGATELDLAIKGLRDKKKYGEIKERIVQINTIENNGDRVLEDALRNLVSHRDDMFEFICWIDYRTQYFSNRLKETGIGIHSFNI